MNQKVESKNVEMQVVLEAKGIYCWPGPDMKATVLFVKQGRMVLTNRRLQFSSKKVNLDVDLSSITRCEATKKRALSVSMLTSDGAEMSYAFGTKMGMPNKDSWVEQINTLRK